MYILVGTKTTGEPVNVLVSKTKKKIIAYLKENGYYWSANCNSYIDDKTTGVDGGSGIDYTIEEVKEI